MRNDSHLTAGSSHVVRPALLLDLDGTVRQSKSGKTFIKDSSDLQIIPGVVETILEFKSDGWLIAGISNQGGVAHGFKTPYQIEEELATMVSLMGEDLFDVIRVCYAMDGGSVFPYNNRSLLRKPDIGMLATIELDAWRAGIVIKWDNSLMVGDREEDYLCARNAGINFKQPKEFFGIDHPAEIFKL